MSNVVVYSAHNPLMDRLAAALGPPDRIDDVGAFVREYRRQLDQRFSQATLSAAADDLLQRCGRFWPSIKDCVDACLHVMESAAAQARAKEARTAKPDDAYMDPGPEAKARVAALVKGTVARLKTIGPPLPKLPPIDWARGQRPAWEAEHRRGE